MKDSQQVEGLFGRDGVTLRLPANAEILAGPGAAPLPNPDEAVRDALAAPIGTPPLTDMIAAEPGATVAITLSDVTRPVPYRVLLPPLLDDLRRAGVSEGDITLIVGTGMHRPSTAAEKREMFGADVVQRYEVIDHRADCPESLITVSDDPPVRVCKRFLEADVHIVTGLIEPHFMAGFSGGRKGVCPALVDLRTVQHFHGFDTLSQPSADNGVLEGNPCHDIALGIAREVGVDFLLNVAITQDRSLAGVYAGDLQAAHETGCREVCRAVSVTVTAPFDLVITNGGGYPLDETLYQTVKGMCTALPALGPQSHLLQISACGEGLGSQAYRDMLLSYGKNWRGFLRDIEANRHRTLLDQWEFQMQCRVLARIGIRRLHLVTDGIPQEIQARLALSAVLGPGSAAQRIQAYIDQFVTERPDARLAVIPDGPYTLLTRPQSQP